MKQKNNVIKKEIRICRPQDLHPYACEPLDCSFKEEHILINQMIIMDKLKNL